VLIADSGGAGRQRGGLGTRVTIEARDDGLTLTYGLEGKFNPPQGVRGGASGSVPEAWVETADGTRKEIPVVGRFDMSRGERVVSIAPGGGGYGDPLERSVDAVLDDLREGRITSESARSTYGVVVSEGVVDDAATAAARRTEQTP
jgi:N-methylhydantoinase B